MFLSCENISNMSSTEISKLFETSCEILLSQLKQKIHLFPVLCVKSEKLKLRKQNYINQIFP